MIEEFEKTSCPEMNAILDLILMNRLLKLPPKIIECKPRIYEKIESWSRRQSKVEHEIESILFDGVEIRKGTFLMSNPFQIVEFYGTI